MSKVLGLTAVYSDGSSADDAILTYYPTDPETGKPFTADDGVWVKIRPISQRRFNEAERRHTKKKKDDYARRLVEDADYMKVQDELIQFSVIDWEGIAARSAVNGAWEPFPFAEDKKMLLPAPLKNELIKFATEAQSVEVPADSFRRA